MNSLSMRDKLITGGKRALLTASISAPLGLWAGRKYARSHQLPIRQMGIVFAVGTAAHMAFLGFASSFLNKEFCEKHPYKFIFFVSSYSLAYCVAMPIFLIKKGCSPHFVQYVVKWQFITGIITSILAWSIVFLNSLDAKIEIAEIQKKDAESNHQKIKMASQKMQLETQQKIQAAQDEAKNAQTKAQAALQDAQIQSQIVIMESLKTQAKVLATQTALDKAQAAQDSSAEKIAKEQLEIAKADDKCSEVRISCNQLLIACAQLKIQIINDTAQAKILAAQSKAEEMQSKLHEAEAKAKAAKLAWVELCLKKGEMLAKNNNIQLNQNNPPAPPITQAPQTPTKQIING